MTNKKKEHNPDNSNNVDPSEYISKYISDRPLSKKEKEKLLNDFIIWLEQGVQIRAESSANVNSSEYISEYIFDQPISREETQEVLKELSKDKTRNRVINYLLFMFIGSVATALIFTGVATFNANADKEFLKDQIPIILSIQTPLFTLVLASYFGKPEG